jgi:hypothetical protein
VPGRKKKRARKSERSPKTLVAPSSPSDVAETWVKEVDGVVRQLVVSKLDATWSGSWEVRNVGDD